MSHFAAGVADQCEIACHNVRRIAVSSQCVGTNVSEWELLRCVAVRASFAGNTRWASEESQCPESPESRPFAYRRNPLIRKGFDKNRYGSRRRATCHWLEPGTGSMRTTCAGTSRAMGQAETTGPGWSVMRTSSPSE